jgi:hypothetical protein
VRVGSSGAERRQHAGEDAARTRMVPLPDRPYSPPCACSGRPATSARATASATSSAGRSTTPTRRRSTGCCATCGSRRAERTAGLSCGLLAPGAGGIGLQGAIEIPPEPDGKPLVPGFRTVSQSDTVFCQAPQLTMISIVRRNIVRHGPQLNYRRSSAKIHPARWPPRFFPHTGRKQAGCWREAGSRIARPRLTPARYQTREQKTPLPLR